MKSFNNDPDLKKQMIEQIKWHQQEDDYIQGKWLTNKTNSKGERKGCQMGCLAQSETGAREAVSEIYHLDLWYVYICETIFEELSVSDSKEWVLRSVEAVPVGFEFDWCRSLFFTKMLKYQLNFLEKDSVDFKLMQDLIDLMDVPFSQIEVEKSYSVAKRVGARRSKLLKLQKTAIRKGNIETLAFMHSKTQATILEVIACVAEAMISAKEESPWEMSVVSLGFIESVSILNIKIERYKTDDRRDIRVRSIAEKYSKHIADMLISCIEEAHSNPYNATNQA